jgi:dephospho-CoA kinase
VILVGLTGGIGSGKSTVSSLLADRGAVIIDGDAITRELQQPGQPLLRVIADRFGTDVLDDEGALIRQRLADIVFNDSDALADLNKIVHPAVGRELERRLAEHRATDNVVILDIPLLAENPRKGLCGTIVVDVPEDIAIERLVEQRGMREEDARARMSNQASRETRRAIADQVIDNAGTIEELRQQVDDVWKWALSLPHVVDDDAGGRSDV